MSTWKYILAGVLAIGLLSGGVRLATLALFTETQSVGANTFSTGTVNITASPASALITFATMAPGDVVTNPMTVTNDGTLQLRYAVTSTTTETVLASQIDLTIKENVTTCTNAGFGVDGTVVYGPANLQGDGTGKVIGDPAQGNQAGDRTRNASTSEVLCFQASLPLSTGNSFQGLSTTATFDFVSEQTTNNP
ncbi:MAG: hypothetical protein HY533_06980 [Chloroflexi bacterium]|nr:hypothetical protein [Chloroflexota bacterium]